MADSKNWVFQNRFFFDWAILNFFASVPMKISQNFMGSKDGSKLWWLPWFLAQNNTCVKICNTVYMYCCEHYCKMMSFVTKFFMHKICKSTWKGFYSPITKEIQKIVILHLQCCTFSIERAWKKNQLFNGATETGPVTLKCRFCKK